MRAAAERIVARCRTLAGISDVAGQTTRTFLSDGMRRANDTVAEWMRQAGLAVSVDAVGNLRGVRGNGPRIALASHLDTVVNAGAFDGPLGVLLAIEAAAAFDGALEVIGFSEEEGVRFGTPFIGSRGVVGTLDDTLLGLKDNAGVSVAEAIEAYGLELGAIASARLSADVMAYLEVHLEQGPVLEAEDRALAAVSAIAGQTRLQLKFLGQANHAGTTPMRLRQDALAAAAAWIGSVEAAGLATEGLVATVGTVSALPGLGNVVPGMAMASLDVRHADDEVRTTTIAALLLAANDAALRRGVAVSHTVLLDQAAVALDSRLMRALIAAAKACGYDASALISGAGHDAMIMAPHVPSAMLFVRTPGGVSHHPSEAVAVEDVEGALRTTIAFLRRLKPESADA